MLYILLLLLRKYCYLLLDFSLRRTGFRSRYCFWPVLSTNERLFDVASAPWIEDLVSSHCFIDDVVDVSQFWTRYRVLSLTMGRLNGERLCFPLMVIAIHCRETFMTTVTFLLQNPSKRCSDSMIPSVIHFSDFIIIKQRSAAFCRSLYYSVCFIVKKNENLPRFNIFFYLPAHFSVFLTSHF